MMYDLYSLILAAAKIRGMVHYPKRWQVWLTYARIRLTQRRLQWSGKCKNSENFLGMRMQFFDYPTFAYLFEEIFVQGTYFFQARHARPVVVDAGSNIGMSVLFIKWLYPQAQVRAFEPDPETFAMLRKNIALNNLKDVELFNVALSTREGHLHFHSDRAGSLGGSLLSERLAVTETQTVSTQSLSSFLTGPVDFMKMDIEGAESECLHEAATQGRLRNVFEMVIECHHNLPGRERILTEVLPVLEANGFRYQVRSSSAVERTTINFPQDVILHAFQAPQPEAQT